MTSIVRDNLMTRPGYTPYCGAPQCTCHNPRTTFVHDQFVCRCGWVSAFPPEFIAAYRKKWRI